MENKTNIIILAAGDIRNKFNYIKNNCSSPALIPVNTRPLANYVIEFYCKLENSSNYNIFLVIGREAEIEVKRELDTVMKNHNVSLILIENSYSVNDSLKKALSQISQTTNTIVNLVTSIPTIELRINQVAVDKELSSNTDWSVIKKHEEFISFYQKSNPIKIKGNAFSGIFCVKTEALNTTLSETNIDADLLSVIKNINKISTLDFVETNWIDCGHEINYYYAKRQLINSRAFNNLTVKNNGVVIKSSSNSKKLEREANYTKKLPKTLIHYFPRIIDTYRNKDSTRFTYEMEYYGYPNVSELILYWNIQEVVWENFFKNLGTILNTFKKYPSNLSSEQYFDFYFSKTSKRIEEYKEQLNPRELDSLFFNDSIKINNTTCLSFENLKIFLSDFIKKMYRKDDFCIMHGDYCFNNILYDIPNDIVKLIDARGSFDDKTFSIYGDQKYDIAKLCHSAVYSYDYIVNDLFLFEEKNKNYKIVINHRKNQQILNRLFDDFITKLGYDKQEIKLITGLLFLSMTPIHNESKLRQKVMYLHGLQIINEVYNGK